MVVGNTWQMLNNKKKMSGKTSFYSMLNVELAARHKAA